MDVLLAHPIVLAAIGLAIGGGIMILAIARWGRKLFGLEETAKICPFAQDHPTFQKFMGESIADRKNMRDFLEDINGKVNVVGSDTREMKGKLDLLLQGARVRWNNGLIPLDKRK
jgi:hypothetical protein